MLIYKKSKCQFMQLKIKTNFMQYIYIYIYIKTKVSNTCNQKSKY